MKFSAPLLIVAATSTLAFIVPTDAPDGLLSVTPDASGKRDGHVTWKLISPYNATETALGMAAAAVKHRRGATTAVERRWGILPNPKIGCGSDQNNLDPSEYGGAFYEMRRRCSDGDDTFIKPGSALIYKVGSTGVYSCSWGGWQSCTSQEVEEAMTRINADCKSGTRPGWALMDDWAKSYGRELLSEDICPGLSQ